MDAIIINLDRATERMAFQKAQMEALGLTYRRLRAFDAASAPALRPSTYWDTWERPLVDVEKACLLSHRAAWEMVAASDTPSLILEDDAVLSKRVPDLLARLEKRNGIDLVTLEVRARKKLVSKSRSGLHTGLPIRRLYQDRTGAAAYVLWPEGARKLLKRTARRAGLADAVICATYELQAFQADPALALQIDRCRHYGIEEPIATRSAIDAGKNATEANPHRKLVFRFRRALAQLRMGLRRVAKAPVAVRREIMLDPRDFDHLRELTRG
ncbi:glycosyltransferase family 25 protein [Ciceribacter sp. RN22]|uniref:glycosyltransferase family 25 protein n=1 Tax=Ciceribacter sp. RN22 TaxID=2954932 RepID=UPI002092EC67|nr:glycosyltransferase family 25 protein [Ciceribacter sp. RN22]MCO6178862.1 glycosyltransferase family 25 protein [Ciceribacter sp. RN22]